MATMKKKAQTKVAQKNKQHSQTPLAKKAQAKAAASPVKSNSEKKDFGTLGMHAWIVGDNIKQGVKNSVKNSKAGRAVAKAAPGIKQAATFTGNRLEELRRGSVAETAHKYYQLQDKVRGRVVDSVRKAAPKATTKKATPATRKRTTK